MQPLVNGPLSQVIIDFADDWWKTICMLALFFYFFQYPFLSLVILGSSGKSIIGPMVPESGEEQIHRVQGFILKPDTIKMG